MKQTLILLFSTIFAVTMLQAQKPEVLTNKKPGWHKIGDANVDFKTDKDKFIIMGADKFKSLQVRVTDAPVRMEDMQVQFEGEAKEDISLKSNFKPGTKSRVINLKN